MLVVKKGFTSKTQCYKAYFGVIYATYLCELAETNESYDTIRFTVNYSKLSFGGWECEH